MVKHHFEYVFRKDPELGYGVNNVKYVFYQCLHSRLLVLKMKTKLTKGFNLVTLIRE